MSASTGDLGGITAPSPRDLRLELRDGFTTELREARVTGDSIVGFTVDGQRDAVAITDVKSAKVAARDAGYTVFVLGLTVLAAVAIGYGFLLLAWGSSGT